MYKFIALSAIAALVEAFTVPLIVPKNYKPGQKLEIHAG
jgi:hypothetical protein